MSILDDLEIIKSALPELDLPTDYEPAYPALKRVAAEIVRLNERITELEEAMQ